MRDFDDVFRAAGASAAGFLLLMPSILLALAIPYAILRIRDSQSKSPDPQLGLKAGLNFFFSCGIFLVLIGATVIVVDLLMRNDNQFGNRFNQPGMSSAMRTGLAFITSGFLFGLVHLLVLILGTDDLHGSPDMRRTFTGWRFAIHGMVVLFCVTALCVILFGRSPRWSTIRPFFGILLVWVPSWIGHLILLCVRARPARADIRRSRYEPQWEDEGEST